MRPLIVPTLLVLCISACNAPESNTNQPLPANSGLQPVAQNRGVAKLNPQPQGAHDVLLNIQGAPGPFAVVLASAQFDVINENECGQIDPSSGTAARITSHEPLVLKRMTGTEYRATVYLDQMLDEDYYSRGVCRWQLTALQTQLQATGAKEETVFRSTLTAEQLQAKQPVDTYYWKGGYPRSTAVGYRDSGHPTAESHKPELRGALFKLTLQGL
ncbi:hypothetical protein [Lysobacter sp. CA199]|uniref:hypothetical protein n=1 Tax=Lysobacter sp. CA199 TaxID=3455608 RepID=UPI003F8D19A8